MKFILAFLLSISLLFVTNALAASEALKQCLTEHSSCIQNCLTLESEGSQAACVTKCATGQATCAGQVGLGTSKPFLDQKIEQLDQFLNDFMEDLIPQTPEPPLSSGTTNEQDT